MDPARNPFAPGAGNPPPELAGRDEVLEAVELAMVRVRSGRYDRGHLLLGLRGVGKTVLLNEVDRIADKHGLLTVVIEAPEEGKLAEMLVPRLRSVLIKLSRKEKAKDLAKQSLATLRSFASVFKITVGGVEVAVTEADGVADSGMLELDLPDLLLAIGRAAQAGETGVVLIIDEVQYLSPAELSALIVAIHAISQKSIPVMLFGGGLPQLAGLAGDAKSYAERLFRYPAVGALSREAAINAIRKPIQEENGEITDDALETIIELTQGYPYFLQEWGYHTWNIAPTSPITAQDVEAATAKALAHLDSDFFKVRLDRLQPREKEYLRAMADLGPGHHRSGAIAKRIGSETTSIGFLRDTLIKKGMIYSPKYAMNAFTVPLFDDFMRRTMPDWRPGATEAEAVSGDDESEASDGSAT